MIVHRAPGPTLDAAFYEFMIYAKHDSMIIEGPRPPLRAKAMMTPKLRAVT